MRFLSYVTISNRKQKNHMPKLQPGALTRGTIRFYLVTQTLIRQPSS
ncbi:MAG: hypothetical protein E7D87_09210 [Streptococcus salivarius]|nr:hypothetical protein [Streptococcus salivarius]